MTIITVTDADLQIRGGGGHVDPEIRGGAVSKKSFSALRASIWSRNKRKPQPPLAPSLDPSLNNVDETGIGVVVLV